MLGFVDYTLHIAPEGMRAAYIGFSNTVMGVMMALPALGGWLLEATSYPVLFAVTASFAAASVLVSLQLRQTRPAAKEHPM